MRSSSCRPSSTSSTSATSSRAWPRFRQAAAPSLLFSRLCGYVVWHDVYEVFDHFACTGCSQPREQVNCARARGEVCDGFSRETVEACGPITRREIERTATRPGRVPRGGASPPEVSFRESLRIAPSPTCCMGQCIAYSVVHTGVRWGGCRAVSWSGLQLYWSWCLGACLQLGGRVCSLTARLLVVDFVVVHAYMDRAHLNKAVLRDLSATMCATPRPSQSCPLACVSLSVSL